MMKVLIVDGSKQNRRSMVEALGQLTNVVVQGAVGETRTALYAIADSLPDVVVAGVPLPDGDGTHLIERVRRLARTPSIIVVGGAGSHDHRTRYLAAGADRYVEADEDMRALQETVATLGRPRPGIPTAETQRLLGRMTAGVVHDINNHLTGIEVVLELIRRTPGDEQLWTQLRGTLDAIGRLSGNVLAYARGGVPASSPIDLGVIVRDTLALAGSSIPHAVRVHVEIAANLPLFDGVRSELEQLVLNLIVNACDAMPAGGDLAITVKPTTTGVLLEVIDSGNGVAGVAPEGLAASTKRNGGGLGLGIVNMVVDKHGGAVRIASRVQGGTHVAIVFPATR